VKANPRSRDYALPSVVFTSPALARVGLDEGAARSKGLRFSVHHEDTSGWYTSRRIALAYSGFTTLVDDDTDQILGAHLLGANVEELVNVFALAMRVGLTARGLKDTVFAYPSGASDIRDML
jgi:glutathione reductase (NADPH)